MAHATILLLALIFVVSPLMTNGAPFGATFLESLKKRILEARKNKLNTINENNDHNKQEQPQPTAGRNLKHNKYNDDLKKQIQESMEKLPEEVVFNETEVNSFSCALTKQKFSIKHKLCLDKKIMLPSCTGFCNSLYMPGNTAQDTLGMCDSCQPISKSYKLISVFCPYAETQKVRYFKVEVFDGCKCNSCHKSVD